MKKLDWEKFRDNFHDSWWPKMQKWIESEQCYDIYQQLKKDGGKILPVSKHLWKAFKWTNYNKLKCIMVGQSPYHTVLNGTPYADGLAFSCSLTNKLSPSLEVLYDALGDDLDRPRLERNPDLHYWAFQDVLMLNIALTIDAGNKDSFQKHEVMWQPFIEYLFTEVLNTVTGVPILLFGRPAEDVVLPYLDELSQPYMSLKHPAYYARKEEPMVHNKCFTWVNDILMKNNAECIYWDYDEYLDKGLPF